MRRTNGKETRNWEKIEERGKKERAKRIEGGKRTKEVTEKRGKGKGKGRRKDGN